MESILYVIVIKKYNFQLKLRISWKIQSSASLINRDSFTFSFPCCCQCRFKRYIAKQMNSKTKETVLLWHQPAFLTTYLLSFPFSFDVASHKLHDSFILSFFFSLIFPFFKDYYKKHQRSHFLFFLPFYETLCVQTLRCIQRMLHLYFILLDANTVTIFF